MLNRNDSRLSYHLNVQLLIFRDLLFLSQYNAEFTCFFFHSIYTLDH